MSYILDALKKSEQQRRRGSTPTLPESEPIPAVSSHRFSAPYALAAVILLAIGIAVGWLRPWQAELPTTVTLPAAENPSTPARIESPVETGLTPPEQPKAATTSLRPLVPNIPPLPVARITDYSQQNADAIPPNPAAAEPRITPTNELPLAIQQELSSMKIQLHAYSKKPANRLVSINSRIMHEGETLSTGLLLEQITPGGMIFNYKGLRFQRGIQ